MDEKTFGSKLTELFSLHGMAKHLSFEKSKQFYQMTEHLIAENEKFNLTAITLPEKVILLHYVDSLTLLPHLPKGAKVIDVGTGAGFPALPLAICRPDLHIVAADATEKRVRYVEETAKMLGLSNIEGLVLRAEDGGKNPLYREKFDVACARGVAALRVLCEYCMPFVKVGGTFLAMKGQGAKSEVSDAKRAISMLGGKYKDIIPCPLHDGKEDIAHQLVVIEKLTRTSPTYPRDNSQITKKPL